MDTCCFRIRCIILVFYWMSFNSVAVHSTLLTSMASTGHYDGSRGKWPYSMERKEPSTPFISSKTTEDIYRIGQPHPKNRQAFSKSVYSFQVNENTPPGTMVGHLLATNTTGHGPVFFSMLEDDGDGLFLLRTHSGEFFLSRGLDYEMERYYVLTIGVRNRGGWLSRIRVYFSVMDINDNPPVFSPSTYSISVLENSAVGTCFLTLNVSDMDDGVNAELNWAVIAGDEEAKFAVNSSGVVCLQGSLDRERVSMYNLTVRVNDLALPADSRLTSTGRVIVLVEDVNDNAPSFVSVERLHVLEDTPLHAVVIVIQAIDDDSGHNGEVEYGLENLSGGTFTINSSSGRVFLEEPLDREHTDVLIVLLMAWDKGSPRLSSSMNLTVLVDDVNDNDPSFPQSTYSVMVSEDISKGTSLLHVQAHDPDTGPNGLVRYQLYNSKFRVDPVHGVIMVTDRLDREKNSSYMLTVTAIDQGDPPRSATAFVNVTVTDVNDCAPILTPTLLSLHILENTEHLPQVIYQVSALDEDLGINSQLTYSIMRGNEEGLFSLSPNGTFSALHSLDRELRAQHTLHIMAVDSGLPPKTGTGTVLILVDDLNDNQPVFTQEVITTTVYEEVPAGTVFATIVASDPDDGVNGQIRYSLEEGNVPFSIDKISGVMFTTGDLDREKVGSYQLTVTGSDLHPTQALVSSATVIVLVEDVNDHWPQFLNGPYVANIPATLVPGSIVCVVRAVDADTGRNANLTYSMFGHNTSQLSINPYRGEIFTSDAVKGADDITVSIRVEDNGDDPKFDTTTVTIRFQNASEFPDITVKSHKTLLSEDAPLGTLVAVVMAESKRTGSVSYYVASGNFGEAFQLHQETGELMISKPLDYETNKEYLIWVEARDRGSPPFSSYAEIRINITDVNDNSPVFSQSVYKCEVPENLPARTVCGVTAIDGDSGIYGEVQYSILINDADNTFTIESDTGILKTVKSLDREEKSHYNVTIQAIDKQNNLNTDTAVVLVVVLDANDHAPRFSQIFFTEIPEDTPVGFTVIQITSIDEDIGSNALIVYTIIDQSSSLPFAIDGASGNIVIVQPLDRETEDHYVIKVNANDSAWSISTDITIDITDINDNRPVFSQSLYLVTITETKAQEVFVMQVHATDSDFGSNKEILYYIEPPNELFGVNISTGSILTKQSILLHDTDSRSFSFTVQAFDCGDLPNYSNTTVIVTMVRYNYFPPDFLPFRSVLSIPFNLDLGTKVIQLSAVDQESHSSGTSVEYIVSGGNASSFFEVEVNSGWVLLNGSLRQSLNALLTLLVTARDKGVPPLSSQASISFIISGENHFTPDFLEPWATFSVPEDLPLGSVIGKVQALDEDEGVNGLLHYSFEGGNEDLLFSIGQSTGLITLIRELDSEKQGVHFVQILARDGGWLSKTGKINITVNVTDVNDNPPVFYAAEYTASVQENSPVGTIVLQAKATDADSGINAQITFSLVAGHIDKFSIDPRDGIITTQEIFDFELQQNFEVTVKASNTGNHHLFSTVHVHIQVKGVNEFNPTFQRSQYKFSVSERSPNKTRVGKVLAMDYDLGPDGEVFYLLIGQSKRAGYEIDERSGEIFTSGDLRKQGRTQALLRILAKNRGSINGSDVDETIVLVNVTDANDPPVFSSALYTAEVSEDVAVGTSVIRVTAEDKDSVSEGNRFIYSVKNGNEHGSFTLDPITGILSVSTLLDREQWPVYNLSAVAIDRGYPPATGSTSVVVMVNDVNDSPPHLISTDVNVRENQPPGTVISILNASDDDLPPNQGPFTYWLAKPTFGSVFALSPEGVLYTTRSIDREQSPMYSVLVVVQDAGTPPLSSTAMVRITVSDENDNPSAPRHVYIEVKYYGSSFPGGHIGNVQPEDPDKSDRFNCSIINGPRNMFSFPFGGCGLWSTKYQGEATYNITVEANDNIHPSVNNSIYVSYKGFTNASMDNCVLFYVISPDFKEFLAFSYLKFVKALNSLFNLQASKTHVFGIKILGDKILLLAAVKSYNGEFLSGEVASSISAAQKKLLEVRSGVEISHITGDPCSVNPCHNGATCTKNIHISQDIKVLESSTLMFVSPKQVEIFNCSCLPGFSGTACESDIDECVENPCQNGGTCLNHLGGFSCHCLRGFLGLYCHSAVDKCQNIKCLNGGTCLNTQGEFHCSCSPGYEGEFCEQLVDSCASSPCLLGTCINHQLGYTCDCPFGVSGTNCDGESYGFQELSFMEFPSLDPRNNIISLELSTVRQNSLLLYNHGNHSSSEFLALEIVGGKVQLSFDLGGGLTRVGTAKMVADGSFHSITARRTGKVASLQVDSCSADEPHGFCFSQSEGVGSERTLDVGSSHMMFGGVRSMDEILPRLTQVRTHDFVGCVRNAKVNTIPLDASQAIVSYNILDRCPRTTSSLCDSSLCQNGGVCHDHWTHHSCSCGALFTGVSCDIQVSEDHALRLNGQAYIEYEIKESYRREQQLRDLADGDSGEADGTGRSLGVEVKLRTAEKDGALLFISGGNGHAALRVMDGKLQYISQDKTPSHLTEVTVDALLVDSRWHILHLFRVGAATIILLDDVPVMNTTESTLDLTSGNVHKIVLGGDHPVETINQLPGFLGCVEYFRFNGQDLPFSGFSEVVEARPSSALVQSGCVPGGACMSAACSAEDLAFLSCLSQPCPSRSPCSTASWVNASCICLHNATDRPCKLCSSGEITSYDLCPSPHVAGAPLWIIAVIIPVTFVIICLALIVILRWQSVKSCQEKRRAACRMLSPRPEQGMDNQAFCGDVMLLGEGRGGRPPDIIGGKDEHKSGAAENITQGYNEADPPGFQMGLTNSELEYYEIGSTSTDIFRSDPEALQPRRSGGGQKSPHARIEPIVKGSKLQNSHGWIGRDFKEVLAELDDTHPKTEIRGHKQTMSSSDRKGCMSRFRHDCGMDNEPPLGSLPSPMRVQVPDLGEPPQGLSAEEVRRLNESLHQQKGHAHPAGMTDSSDSESHSSFTCSEYGCEREPPFIGGVPGHFYEQASLTIRQGQMTSMDACSSLREAIPYAEAQRGTNSACSGRPLQWETLLNPVLHFETYAQVFEDIAGLPVELQHDFDWQSEAEEII